MKKIRLFLLSISILPLLALGGCGPGGTPDELVDAAARELAAGRTKEAAAAINRAVKLAPERFDALILQAIILERRGKLRDAIEAAGRAAGLRPDSFTAQYTLGCLYAADRKYYHDALVAFGKALHMRPADRNTLIQLANVGMKLNPVQAMKHLDELARHRAVFNSAEYQNMRGVGLIQRRQFPAAERAFLKACQLAPDSAICYHNLAVCMDRYLDKGSRAAKFYRRYLELAPETPENLDSRKRVEARMQVIRSRH